MSPRPASIAIPFAAGCLGIALFSVMDAVMKHLVLAIGAFDAVLWRTLLGTFIAAAIWLPRRPRWPDRATLRIHIERGLVMAPMGWLFFWGIGQVPLAQAIALAFVAPLIALYLAAILLGEKIKRRAILASLLGFAGVLVIFAAQATADLGPDALLGSLAILVSAGLYAYNIILMRRQALVADPVEVAFFMSAVVAGSYLLLAPWLASPPPVATEGLPILVAALLSIGSHMLLSWAYARAEAQHLAPVEYTAFLWASLLGFLVFAEPVRPLTLLGAVFIVAACLLAATRRPATAPAGPEAV
jgi:S-adenosylmethionine uptake transporter